MLIQLLANGFVTGCSYALVGLGFGLIYNTTGVFHFAHGAVYTLCAFLFYQFYIKFHWALIPSVAITVVIAFLVGIIIDELIYAPLARRGSSLLIQLLSSLGLYIIIVNVVAMIFGNDTKILTSGVEKTLSFGSVILTKTQVATVLAFLFLFGGLLFLLRKTNMGKIIRGMSDSPELLSIMGIDQRMVRWTVFSLGSGLAAVAAILSGLDTGIDPHIGMSAVLNGAVAVIIGGVGIFEGAALGGLTLGLLQGLVIWKFSAKWQDLVSFGLLMLFLLFRPQGIIGKRQRVEESAQ